MIHSLGTYRQFTKSQNYGSLLKKLNLTQTYVVYFGHNICFHSFWLSTATYAGIHAIEFKR